MTNETDVKVNSAAAPAKAPERASQGSDSRGGAGRERGRRAFDKPKSEFDQKILNIRRVTRVVSGGRRMSFAVAIVIGDRKGKVGVGTGKATDTSLAINKAIKSAKKNMIKIPMEKNMSIRHEVEAKYSSARINIMPNKGRGIVAGSAVRDIINLAGLHDVTSKIHSSSKNKLNIARATIKALSALKAKQS